MGSRDLGVAARIISASAGFDGLDFTTKSLVLRPSTVSAAELTVTRNGRAHPGGTASVALTAGRIIRGRARDFAVTLAAKHPDLSWLAVLTPRRGGLAAVVRSGEVLAKVFARQPEALFDGSPEDAAINGTLELSAAGGANVVGVSVRGNVTARGGIDGLDLGRRTLRMSRLRVAARDVAIDRGSEHVRGWWGDFDLPRLEGSVAEGLDLGAHVNVRARDGAPLLAMLVGAGELPGWIPALFPMKDLRAAVDVRKTRASSDSRARGPEHVGQRAGANARSRQRNGRRGPGRDGGRLGRRGVRPRREPREGIRRGGLAEGARRRGGARGGSGDRGCALSSGPRLRSRAKLAPIVRMASFLPARVGIVIAGVIGGLAVAPSGCAGDPSFSGDAGGAGGAASGAGGAAAPSCQTPEDCSGDETECVHRTCTAGQCGLDYAAQGFLVGAQATGDCQKTVCDGKGGIATVPDDADKPSDGNDCTTDVCAAGKPSHPATPKGTACGATQKLTCDGQGNCTGCTTGSDCGANTACVSYACEATACKIIYVPSGTGDSGGQTIGDCKKRVCNGAGGPETVNDPADVPKDGNPCTQDLCSMGQPSHASMPAGSSCGGSKKCDGNGTCVGCIVDSDCGPGVGCTSFVCQSSSCKAQNAPNGTACNDGVDCTINDVCSSGACSGSAAPAGTPCGGGVCDGAQTCCSAELRVEWHDAGLERCRHGAIRLSRRLVHHRQRAPGGLLFRPLHLLAIADFEQLLHGREQRPLHGSRRALERRVRADGPVQVRLPGQLQRRSLLTRRFRRAQRRRAGAQRSPPTTCRGSGSRSSFPSSGPVAGNPLSSKPFSRTAVSSAPSSR